MQLPVSMNQKESLPSSRYLPSRPSHTQTNHMKMYYGKSFIGHVYVPSIGSCKGRFYYMGRDNYGCFLYKGTVYPT